MVVPSPPSPLGGRLNSTRSKTADSGWTNVSLDITSYASTNTQIRFTAGSDLRGDPIYLDDVAIVKGTIVNSVTATGADLFGTALTATDTEPVMPGTPGLSITKTADDAGPLEDDDPQTYTVTVRNTGSTVQSGVVVEDALPEGLTWVSGTVTIPGLPALNLTDGFDCTGTSVTDPGSYQCNQSAWGSSWIESGDDGSATTGNLLVTTASTDAATHKFVYQFGEDMAGKNIHRTADLSLYAGQEVTLSLDYLPLDAKADDVLKVDVTNDVGSVTDFTTAAATSPWVTAISATKGTTTGWQTATWKLDQAYLTDDFAIRISQLDAGNGETWQIDNVSITAAATTDSLKTCTAPTDPATDALSGCPDSPYTLAPYVADVGPELTFVVNTTVTGAPEDGFQFSNRASVTSTQQSAPVSDAVSTPYLDPSFDITKTAVETWANFANNVVTYRIEVRNTGNSVLKPTDISDTQCDSLLFSTASTTEVEGDLNADLKLQVGETWTFECTNTVSSTDADPDSPDDVPNTVSATFNDTQDQPVTETATAHVKVLHPSIEVTASPSDATILSGGTVSYTYTLDNTGDVAITNPSVTPSNCTPAVYHDGDTDNDRILDVDETWTFTCTTSPLTTDVSNATVTASGNALIFGTPVTDAVDVAVNVNVINPAIAVDKKVYDSTFMTAGDAVDALAGAPLEVGVNNDIVYLYTVTNPGDVPLAVTLTDDHTATPPVYVSGDSNGDGKLDPTETWYYTYDANLVDGGYSGTVTGTVVAVGAYDVGTAPTNAAGTVTASDLTNVRVLKPELVLLKEVDAEYVSLGTSVTYHYTVRNSGQTTFALSGIGPRADDTCSPVTQDDFAGTPLDANGNGKLDPGEDLHYSCTSVMDALTDGTTSYSVLNTFTVGLSTDDRGGTYTPGPAVAQVFVVNPGLTVTKTAATQQDGSDAGTDIVGQSGQPVYYTVTVAHTLTTPFGDGRDNLNALSPAVHDPICSPETPIAYQSGDADANGLLNPGETLVYTCALAALPDGDPTVNTVTVTGASVLEGIDPAIGTASATVSASPILVTVFKQALHCDVGQPTCPLPGAEFTLYTADPLGPEPGVGVVLPASVDGASFSTELTVGRDYWLVETRAPDDFQLLAQPIKFHLTREALTLDAGGSDLVTVDGAAFTLTVTNTPAAELPKVGSDGPWPYLGSGLALLLAAGLYLIKTSGPRPAPRRVAP